MLSGMRKSATRAGLSGPRGERMQKVECRVKNCRATAQDSAMGCSDPIKPDQTTFASGDQAGIPKTGGASVLASRRGQTQGFHSPCGLPAFGDATLRRAADCPPCPISAKCDQIKPDQTTFVFEFCPAFAFQLSALCLAAPGGCLQGQITKRTQIFWSKKQADLTMAKRLTSICDAKSNWVRLGSFGGSPEFARARQRETEGEVALPPCRLHGQPPAAEPSALQTLVAAVPLWRLLLGCQQSGNLELSTFGPNQSGVTY